MAWFPANLSSQPAAAPIQAAKQTGSGVFPKHWEGTAMKISGWRAGTIKLPFRKLNSILCEHSARSA
jgi:hypothetical protein